MTSDTVLKSSRWRSPVAPIGVALALCLALAARAGPVQTPQLSTTTLEGQSFNLDALRGHVVLVHFWATWCVPCRQEMPALDSFYQRYRERGVEVIGISVDRGRDIDQVRQVMKAFHFPAAMQRDAGRNDFGAQNALPVTFVIDPQGRVDRELRPDPDPLTEAQLVRVVEPLLRAH